jgi:hypothetical protein
MKKLFKFEWDCGRMGIVDGLFIATEKEVDNLIGKEIYLGDALGKHSDISGTIEANEIKILGVSQDVVLELEKQGNTLCGYNPLEYIETD